MNLLDKFPIKNWLGIKATNSNVDVRVQAGATIMVMFAILVVVLIWAIDVIRTTTQQSAAALGKAQAASEYQAQQYAEQAKRYMLYERRVMDVEGVLIAEGIKLPSDREFGALGNLQRVTKKQVDYGR